MQVESHFPCLHIPLIFFFSLFCFIHIHLLFLNCKLPTQEIYLNEKDANNGNFSSPPYKLP